MEAIGKLIDTHCHLCHSRLRAQMPAVLTRARQAGVAAIICAAGDLQESWAALDLACREPEVFCLAGVHPHEAKQAPPDYLDQLKNLAASPKNVAIGEIGLDYHYDFSPREVQRRVFAEQLALARQLGKLGKKAVIHTREAFDDTMGILIESKLPGLDVEFHSWTGDSSEVRKALDFGATISFSGIVTFQNAREVRDSAGLVSLDRLLIETDAPYLSPEPVRRMKTNEPANVAHVAAFLARLHSVSCGQLAEQTSANARKFFGLIPQDAGRPG